MSFVNQSHCIKSGNVVCKGVQWSNIMRITVEFYKLKTTSLFLFGEIDGFAGDGTGRFSGDDGLRNDGGGVGSFDGGGAVGLLSFTPSQVIGSVTISCQREITAKRGQLNPR